MTHTLSRPIALLYDDDAYVDAASMPDASKSPIGQIGRQVAGREFLDAYLSYGTWEELVALVYNQESIDTLKKFFRNHPSSEHKRRLLRLVNGRRFQEKFFPAPPARLLFNPCPPKIGFAWSRQYGGENSFSICGVTHSICDAGIIHTLCSCITAPFEEYDALICTSKAAVRVVKAVTNNYCEYLAERFGGKAEMRMRLEQIPLGVNPEKFRPPTLEERKKVRVSFNISEEEIVILYVGRLLYHGKAHPFPMFEGVSRAARETGRKVHLILAGWSNDGVIEAFRSGAETFAPNIRLTIVDGLKARDKAAPWHAADIFTSLSDSLQETFGLSVAEAMSCGLPVVASDWDGYKDIVENGETGFLIPTYMVKDAVRDITSRLIGVEELTYDNFLAESNQTVVVDAGEAAEAYRRLIADAGLREAMGKAGRERVLKKFAWRHIIAAYENLWLEQEKERTRQWMGMKARNKYHKPSVYPSIEHSFGSFPSRVLNENDLVMATEDAMAKLPVCLQTVLTNYKGICRSKDTAVIEQALKAAVVGMSIEDLDKLWESAGVPHVIGRNTLAWMLKYNLLRVAESPLR